ncbi:isoprenylcysteine carboxylmethyltransferase family protein [Deinococcus sp. YIM 134068]|uniref:methyltransferase family protein n=1 Tax=Deinococcus lichenicola TaxID=3118910 RepID=UPI002F935D71
MRTEQAGQLLVAAQLGLLALILADGIRTRPRPRTVRVAGTLVGRAGLLLAVWSARSLGRQLTPLPDPVPGGVLVERGPYRAVRHPLYTGLLLASLGWTVARGGRLSALGTALLAVVLNVKAAREEDALTRTYPTYAAYRARTGRFLPRWR